MLSPQLIPRFNQDVSVSDMRAAFTDNDLGEEWQYSHYLFNGSGRYSLFLALKSLEVRVKKIVIPSFICPAVFDGVLESGFDPVVVDVDDDLLMDLDKVAALKEEFSVILAHHTFGKRMDIGKLKARFPEKTIIEDCCHDPTRLLDAGELESDFVFYSFGLSKFLTIGNGGLLVVRDADRMERVKAAYSRYTESKGTKGSMALKVLKGFVFAQLYKPPLYGLFARELGVMVERFVDLSGKRGVDYEELSEYFRRMFCAKYQSMPDMVSQQRENTLRLVDGIHNPKVRLLPRDYYAVDHINFMFPTMVKDKKKFHLYLRRRNVDSCLYLDTLPNYYEEIDIEWSHCRKTAQALSDIIAIPNHYSLSKRQVDHIIEVVNEY